MKRSKHSLSHYKLASFDAGMLVPVGMIDVLPGDSVRMSTSMLLRLSPLATPVMHPVHVRLHHWFVPFRILWPRESAEVGGFEQFITGGEDGEGDGAVFPSRTAVPLAGSILDYMGIPPGTSVNYSLLPVRAYNMIYNEFYRDQDLSVKRDQDLDTDVAVISWEKDIFTAARPWTQKGPTVTMPLGDTAPVVPDMSNVAGGSSTPLFTADGAVWPGPAGSSALSAVGGFDTPGWALGDPGTTGIQNVRWGDGNGGSVMRTGLLADLEQAGGPDVNAVRLAFALQRYQEARAQFGSRYTEYLRYLGIRSSDARLQRPEYLGGGRATVSFSEVLRTGNDDGEEASPIGQMRGHGISALRTRPFVRFFEEHGVVLTLASVRPKSMYADGIHRSWIKRTKEDYFQKELETIGQQEVYYKEVYTPHATPDGVFGWNDRYYEYRHQPSSVAGEFRTVYNDWHWARLFGSDPALNAEFVLCDPGKRIFQQETNSTLLGMFSHSIQARRMVGNRVIGRIF